MNPHLSEDIINYNCLFTLFPAQYVMLQTQEDKKINYFCYYGVHNTIRILYDAVLAYEGYKKL